MYMNECVPKGAARIIDNATAVAWYVVAVDMCRGPKTVSLIVKALFRI